MIKLFIKHILGINTDHSGIFGRTSAYYGTVEQQGCLTLHLHLLLWIEGLLPPDEVKLHIMEPNSEFQKHLIEYLEGVHVGEFLTGTKDEVLKVMAEESQIQPLFIQQMSCLLPHPFHVEKSVVNALYAAKF